MASRYELLVLLAQNPDLRCFLVDRASIHAFCNFSVMNSTIRFAQMSAESYVETPISAPAKFVLAPFPQ